MKVSTNSPLGVMKAVLFLGMVTVLQSAWSPHHDAPAMGLSAKGNLQQDKAQKLPLLLPNPTTEVSAVEFKADSVYWIQVSTDSGVVHAAIATPPGKGPFPAVIILHGTHGFAQEYVDLARDFAKNGLVGIAACWFAGRKGAGERFITPIDFADAPPLVDVAGSQRFRIARHTLNLLVEKVATLPDVQKDQLAFFGHSRGAGAVLDYLLNYPGKAQAAILNSSGYPPEVTKRAAEVEVPLLMLHGIADDPADGGSAFTAIAMARQFEAALKAEKKEVQVRYYEGSGHNAIFTNANQFDETVQRASAFLKSRFLK